MYIYSTYLKWRPEFAEMRWRTSLRGCVDVLGLGWSYVDHDVVVRLCASLLGAASTENGTWCGGTFDVWARVL